MAGSYKISGLPIRARLCRYSSWQVKGTTPDQPLTISRSEVGETRRCFDVWPVRDRFLALGTWGEAFEFFSDFGPFIREDKELQIRDPSREEITTVDLATVREHQHWFKGFMEDEKWYSNEPVTSPNPSEHQEHYSRLFRSINFKGYESPSFTLKMGYVPIKKERVHSPFLDYEGEDIYRAVYASIYIDKMRGLRGGVCQREGCANTFLTTDPRKRFCDDPPGICSAVVRMQMKRRAERIAKQAAEAMKATKPAAKKGKR